MVKVSTRNTTKSGARRKLSLAGCLLLGGFLVVTAIAYFDLGVISGLKVNVPESYEEDQPEIIKVMSDTVSPASIKPKPEKEASNAPESHEEDQPEIIKVMSDTVSSAPIKPKPEKEASSTCSATFEQLCSQAAEELVVRMAAVPHTASSTTSRVFNLAKKFWSNSSALNGFECADPNKRLEPTCLCNGDAAAVLGNTTHLFECVMKRLSFRGKAHSPYVKLAERHSSSQAIFTILRTSDQFVLSQYNMRHVWDAVWNTMYPNATGVAEVTPVEWVPDAWWRHNLFTKMLATDSKLIWTGRVKPEWMLPSKQESDEQNALAEKSAWLKTALENLAGMPFFGLMHRLTESFELMGFHCCFPVEMTARATKVARKVTPELKQVVDEHFVLDALLLEKAEKLFDDLVADMRRKKAQGVMCDMSRLLREPDMEFGLKCV